MAAGALHYGSQGDRQVGGDAQGLGQLGQQPGPGVAHQPLAVSGHLQPRQMTTSGLAAATLHFQGDPPGKGFDFGQSIFPYQAGTFAYAQLRQASG